MTGQGAKGPTLNRLSADLIAQFEAIVGSTHALTSADLQSPYLTEERGLYVGASPLVLRPGSVAEVASILELANAHRIGIVPQAGNTGLVGGQIPIRDEIVVSTRRLNAIRDVNAAGLSMTLEAGVTLKDAQNAADSAGLLYPLSLASEDSCCIGGNIASNAGGVGVLVYGNTRALTLGLEVVLADGRVLSDLRGLKKNNAGYDLKHLFIGSEGTLGIITAAVLKLFPRPAEFATALVALPGLAAVAELFASAQAASVHALTAFEFMPKIALAMVQDHIPSARLPLALDAPWYVLLEYSGAAADGAASHTLDHVLSQASDEHLVTEAAIATSADQRRKLWHIRESIPYAQKGEGGSIKHDVSVPVHSIPALIMRGNSLIEAICPGCRPVPFGHFGDGNVHFNITQPPGMDKGQFLALWGRMNAAIHDLVSELQGSFAAEHGVGQLKRYELRERASPVALDIMGRIKHALDPNGIMNPGKVL